MRFFLLLLCFSFYSLSGIYAQTIGGLDSAFDLDGKVVNIGNMEEIAFAMAIQADGKIIAAGNVFQTAGTSHFILLRYNTDGSPDTGFGTNGRVETTINGSEDVINCIKIQSDGKIVAGGTTWNNTTRYDFVVARYNSDGSIDNSFGTNGIVIFDLTADDEKVNTIAIQPDGKIIAAGFGSYNFELVRLKSNGKVDSTFGINGVGYTDLINGSDRVRGLAILPDGKIVAAGVADAIDNDFAIARYSSNGILDASFGNKGVVITNHTGEEEAFSLLLQPDGKLVSAGMREVNSNLDVQLIRYNADGTYDNSFGTNGIVIIGSTNNEIVYSSVLQPDGKIVAAGYSYDESVKSKDFMLLRFNPNGTLDNTFGTGGKITTDFADKKDDIAYGIARQSDGKLVAVGHTSELPDIAIARYLTELNIGIEEHNTDAGIRIYPMPANDKISIDLGSNVSSGSVVSIFNALGEEVMIAIGLNKNKADLNVSSLSKGVYILRVQSTSGITTQKLVIQ